MGNICEPLHILFNTLPRFRFPLDEHQIPENGVYVLFEKGEHAHMGDRIVRVGTHTGTNQLRSRLTQHFTTENKDRSIFRKNTGRALLNASLDPFLEQWNWDLTSRTAKEAHRHLLNTERQREVEREVSRRIQSLFSFAVVAIAEKPQRLDLETRIISTISWCSECKASSSWLGLQSPKARIRECDLWLVNGLYKDGLTQTDLHILEGMVLRG